MAEELLSRVDVTIRRFPGTTTSKSQHVDCTTDDLVAHDAYLFGFPVVLGAPSATAQAFFDAQGKVWADGSLTGRPAGVFVSSAAANSGQETAILHFHRTLMHLGLLVVGLDPLRVESIAPGAPESQCFGMTVVEGAEGKTPLTDIDKALARDFASRLGQLAIQLA